MNLPDVRTTSAWLDQVKPSQAPPVALADALTQLRRDGVALIPGYMSESEVQDMRDGIPPVEEFENVSAPGADEALVFLGADRVQCLSPFFHDTRLRHIARAYIGSGATAARRMIEVRWQESRRLAFGQPPLADASQQRLTFLVYLCDVGESDGSLIRRRRSHASTRRPDANRFTTDSVFGEPLTKQEPPAIACCGPKGLLIIYDAAALERTTPRGNDIQTVLVDCWTRKV